MKECWINVYSDGKTTWQGWAYPAAFTPIKIITSKVVYRIHVRLK